MQDSSLNLIVSCPECGRHSDSIKRFILPGRWTLFVYLFYSNVTYTCCPHCMRKHILIQGFKNLITMHFFWPFFILPWMIVQYIRSYQKGHFKGMQSLVDAGYVEPVR